MYVAQDNKENASTSKNFLDVFSKFKLSANVKTVFKNTKVVNIKINQKEQIFNVYLESSSILNESAIKDLEQDVYDNFKFIKHANIYLKYDIKDMSFEEKFKGIWENICQKIREDSHICFVILENANYKIDEPNYSIDIFLGLNASFILKNKKIDVLISDIVKQRFDVILNVNFLDNLTKENILEINKNREEVFRTEFNKQISRSRGDVSNNTSSVRGNNNVRGSNNFSGGSINNNKFRRTKKQGVIIKDKLEPNNNTPIISMKNAIDRGPRTEKIIVSGVIFKIDIIDTKAGKNIINVEITDKSYAINFKIFTNPKEYQEVYKDIIKKNNFIIVKGEIRYDDYSKEINLNADEISLGEDLAIRQDTSEEKRVELHLHTQMSKMDAISSVKDMIKRAKDWGHKAIAITDHGVVQAFPDAMDMAKKLDIKVIYGVEAYFVNDLVIVVENSKAQDFNEEYVVFDLETTGLNREVSKIIEIGAVKIKNKKIIDRFSSFINPQEMLTQEIINLTNIDDGMLKDAPLEDEVMPKFLEFIKDSVLVAHNSKFDMAFIKKWTIKNNIVLNNSVVDTVVVSRTLFKEATRHSLKVLTKKFKISLENHHRAVDDAEATALVFLNFIEILEDTHNVYNLDELNILAKTNVDIKKLRPNHAVILVQSQVGLRNLYELISISNLEYFSGGIPKIPKSEFLRLREGLIIGTACEAGEFYQAILNGLSQEEIEELALFYDYFEIQPIANNKFLIKDEKISIVKNVEDLQNINKKIIEYGKKYNKPVVATSDAHFLDEEENYFRQIIMSAQGFKNVEEQESLHFRTTDEMLEEFSYLGEEVAREVVIENTHYIESIIEDVLPIPNGTFPPEMENSDIELRNITVEKAKSIYGENLPKIVEDRLERELNSIIGNGFAVLYIISQKIVWNSNDNGYIVGSRGSVGSSFAATMAGITEVNPLSPHYFCKNPNCKYSDFESPEVIAYAGNSGWDLPDKACPKCGRNLAKDGHDIPFETFLGFDGDKEPDIDLNFSGEFQLRAHQYTEELFGKDFVFKAGTIGTLADKTAYMYVKKYEEKNNIAMTKSETNRIIQNCIGIKKTTGQHPGGLMVVPSNKSIYDFCPIQRAADDPKSDVITTHFAYKAISGRILKLDLLGHDVPTIIRMLKDFTGFDPLDTPMDDQATISLFSKPDALGVTNEEINCETGSLGLPEFGTPFVIQMLVDTKPNTFSDLVRISGLSHGTDVWFNNAQNLIKDNIATLKEVIPTRDDIMVYLIIKGVEDKLAFTIMESVRKGNGLTKEYEQAMIDKEVPDWYIESCKRIKYMFPKGHAVAYVTNAFRMGYFKINYPMAFYASVFSVKIEDFDYDLMCFGVEKVEVAIRELLILGKNIKTKEKSKLVVLELVKEMYKRGINFVELDLYNSKGFKFDISEKGILPPLCTVMGLGESATQNIIQTRKDGEFNTIEDLVERTKISKTVVDILKTNGVLKGIPDSNQLTLF
ncbi:MAG: PolC-type DNA polymerase III [bacterium]